VPKVTFIFGTSPNTKPEENKLGDMAYYIPRVPHQIAPMPTVQCCHSVLKKNPRIYLEKKTRK